VDEARLFLTVPTDRTRGNGHTLEHRKFRTNTRKNFFILGVTEQCNKMPREVVESPLWRYSKPTWTLSCVIYCREPALAERES